MKPISFQKFADRLLASPMESTYLCILYIVQMFREGADIKTCLPSVRNEFRESVNMCDFVEVWRWNAFAEIFFAHVDTSWPTGLAHSTDGEPCKCHHIKIDGLHFSDAGRTTLCKQSWTFQNSLPATSAKHVLNISAPRGYWRCKHAT